VNTVPCRVCGHPIGAASPYAGRRIGPRCGGRIHTPRTPAVHVDHHQHDTHPDQMALFDFDLSEVAA